MIGDLLAGRTVV